MYNEYNDVKILNKLIKITNDDWLTFIINSTDEVVEELEKNSLTYNLSLQDKIFTQQDINKLLEEETNQNTIKYIKSLLVQCINPYNLTDNQINSSKIMSSTQDNIYYLLEYDYGNKTTKQKNIIKGNVDNPLKSNNNKIPEIFYFDIENTSASRILNKTIGDDGNIILNDEAEQITNYEGIGTVEIYEPENIDYTDDSIFVKTDFDIDNDVTIRIPLKKEKNLQFDLIEKNNDLSDENGDMISSSNFFNGYTFFIDSDRYEYYQEGKYKEEDNTLNFSKEKMATDFNYNNQLQVEIDKYQRFVLDLKNGGKIFLNHIIRWLTLEVEVEEEEEKINTIKKVFTYFDNSNSEKEDARDYLLKLFLNEIKKYKLDNNHFLKEPFYNYINNVYNLSIDERFPTSPLFDLDIYMTISNDNGSWCRSNEQLQNLFNNFDFDENNFLNVGEISNLLYFTLAMSKDQIDLNIKSIKQDENDKYISFINSKNGERKI